MIRSSKQPTPADDVAVFAAPLPLPLKTRVNPLDLMVESGHLPVRYPGKYDIRNTQLRGTNMTSDEDNT